MTPASLFIHCLTCFGKAMLHWDKFAPFGHGRPCKSSLRHVWKPGSLVKLRLVSSSSEKRMHWFDPSSLWKRLHLVLLLKRVLQSVEPGVELESGKIERSKDWKIGFENNGRFRNAGETCPFLTDSRAFLSGYQETVCGKHLGIDSQHAVGANPIATTSFNSLLLEEDLGIYRTAKLDDPGMSWLTYGLDSTFDVMTMWGEQSTGQWRRNSEGGGGNSMQDDCMHASHQYWGNGEMGKWENGKSRKRLPHHTYDATNAVLFCVCSFPLFLFSSFPLFLQVKQESSHWAEMDAAVDLFYRRAPVSITWSVTAYIDDIFNPAHRSTSQHIVAQRSTPPLQNQEKKKGERHHQS